MTTISATAQNITVAQMGVPGPRGQAGDSSFSVNAQSNVIAGSVVTIDPSGIYNPNLAVPADVTAIIGIASTSANAGNPVTVMTAGQITESGWAWSQGPIYCAATGGALTQTPPATGALVQVAIAISPTTIAVGIQPAIFL